MGCVVPEGPAGTNTQALRKCDVPSGVPGGPEYHPFTLESAGNHYMIFPPPESFGCRRLQGASLLLCTHLTTLLHAQYKPLLCKLLTMDLFPVGA